MEKAFRYIKSQLSKLELSALEALGLVAVGSIGLVYMTPYLATSLIALFSSVMQIVAAGLTLTLFVGAVYITFRYCKKHGLTYLRSKKRPADRGKGKSVFIDADVIDIPFTRSENEHESVSAQG